MSTGAAGISNEPGIAAAVVVILKEREWPGVGAGAARRWEKENPVVGRINGAFKCMAAFIIVV
jgi:hypothetical protein